MYRIFQHKTISALIRCSISIVLAASWLSFAPWGCASSPSDNEDRRKNIILFIGDGMGDQHRMAAQWVSVGPNGRLVMDDLLHHGSVRTSSADQEITDSAAAATAMATGVKTNNGVIGLDPQLNEVTTILEAAIIKGKKVGLVTTTKLSNATPAAFVAHVANRTEMTEIASQMMATDIDVLLGGGEDEFLPPETTGCFPEPGERSDGRNLVEAAVALGYRFACDMDSLNAIDAQSTPYLLGLFGDEGMTTPYEPNLAGMTRTAIDILSQSPEGFFLMVEAGQIEWASHSNDANQVIENTLGLDEAVAVAKAYTASHPATLLIVTADHETGGMILSTASTHAADEDGPFVMPDGSMFFVNWTTTDHTAKDVPITSMGPLSDLLDGELENTDIHDVMQMLLN